MNKSIEQWNNAITISDIVRAGDKLAEEVKKLENKLELALASGADCGEEYSELVSVIHEESGFDDHHPNYSPVWAVKKMAECWAEESETVEKLEKEKKDSEIEMASLVNDLRSRLAALEAEREMALDILAPSMRSNGLADACRQRMQAWQSEKDNAVKLEQQYAALQIELTETKLDVEHYKRGVANWLAKSKGVGRTCGGCRGCGDDSSINSNACVASGWIAPKEILEQVKVKGACDLPTLLAEYESDRKKLLIKIAEVERTTKERGIRWTTATGYGAILQVDDGEGFGMRLATAADIISALRANTEAMVTVAGAVWGDITSRAIESAESRVVAAEKALAEMRTQRDDWMQWHDEWKARALAAEKERDEAMVRAAQDQDEHSAQRAALVNERDAALSRLAEVERERDRIEREAIERGESYAHDHVTMYREKMEAQAECSALREVVEAARVVSESTVEIGSLKWAQQMCALAGALAGCDYTLARIDARDATECAHSRTRCENDRSVCRDCGATNRAVTGVADWQPADATAQDKTPGGASERDKLVEWLRAHPREDIAYACAQLIETQYQSPAPAGGSDSSVVSPWACGYCGGDKRYAGDKRGCKCDANCARGEHPGFIASGHGWKCLHCNAEWKGDSKGVDNTRVDFAAIAKIYGAVIIDANDDYITKVNMPREDFINRSFYIGNDTIVLGFYDIDELRTISFFHELGHITDQNKHQNKLDQEISAWKLAFNLAKTHGVKFSEKAISWAFEQLLTYSPTKPYKSSYSHKIEVPGNKVTTKDAPWRYCEFCGCHTNARVRACCTAGYNADTARTHEEHIRMAQAEVIEAAKRWREADADPSLYEDSNRLDDLAEVVDNLNDIEINKK